MSIFELPKNYSGHAIMGAFAIAQVLTSFDLFPLLHEES